MVSSFHTHDAMRRLLRVAVGLPKVADSHTSKPEKVVPNRSAHIRVESGASHPRHDSEEQSRLG